LAERKAKPIREALWLGSRRSGSKTLLRQIGLATALCVRLERSSADFTLPVVNRRD
jgi:hypothetical protein